ncbi:MAG: SPASM domain-containing protein [Hyphomicrobiales bacterium]|nr:SPASM domain-containing protein [Hyphomicrobiales bacterium]MBV8827174.1 SPASM domain-containing protein [Hyphomicrobiales bacterium]
MEHYRASYYNLRVDDGARLLLFNGVTGALLALPPQLAKAIEPFLGPTRTRSAGEGYQSWRPPAFRAEDLPALLQKRLSSLLESGIFVRADGDERALLAAGYRTDRARAPFFVTMTTTLDCNMRCYYCYQKDGALEYMSRETCDTAIAWTQEQIIEKGYPTLHVDWYGGEPMLNQAVIAQYTEAMTRFCDERGVSYRASMLCNGTAWPDDTTGFVRANRLRHIQFSLDGPKRHHNKRRGLVDSDTGHGRAGSYDEVMQTIGSLIGSVRIYLRINVDPWIGRDCLEVIDTCAELGWLAGDTNFYPYVAIINAMTEHCGFIAKAERFEKFNVEYEEIQREFYARLGRHRGPSALEMVQYYPNRVTLNCAAVSNNSVVFGPNGLMYKCGLDVGDHHRAHGALRDEVPTLPAEVSPLAADRWDRYDPFTHERCSECQYLPVCMGGCPKAQIEKNSAQVRLQSAFWENNFDNIIREYYRASGHA